MFLPLSIFIFACSILYYKVGPDTPASSTLPKQAPLNTEAQLSSKMPASIPNDIYQYSLWSAYKAGLRTGGPPVAFLTNHGTHGIGIFEDGSDMIQIDQKAYVLDKNGKASQGPQNKQLPFVKVCVFQPSYRTTAPVGTNIGSLRKVFESGGPSAGGSNTPMPFAVKGGFKSVKTTHQTFENAYGTIFGYAIPSWQSGVSGEGMQCCFLSGDKMTGGRVTEFESNAGTNVEWAKCGRFHLGFPQDEEFEGLEL